jgi:hypothetical protein
MLMIQIGGPSAAYDMLLDIGVGGSGSEVVVIADLLICTKASESSRVYCVPIAVPAGTRIAARCQASTLGVTIRVVITCIERGLIMSPGLQHCDTYGANTADSGGAGVDPGGTAHTKGGWTQIVASTTHQISQMIISIGDRNNNASTTCTWLVDIGIGASTSEVVLFTLFFSAGTTNDEILPCVFGPFPVDIPSGTRIAANAQCSIIDATDRLIDIVIYGSH